MNYRDVDSSRFNDETFCVGDNIRWNCHVLNRHFPERIIGFLVRIFLRYHNKCGAELAIFSVKHFCWRPLLPCT